jgi:hypothetical protein
MKWVDDIVAVGNWTDARDVDGLRSEGVDFMVDARALFTQSLLRFDKIPLVKEVLRVANLLVALSSLKPKVMIRCYHGRDRSPFVAMIYVSKKYDMTYKDAYDFVRQRVPRTVYHWDWVRMLGS